MKKKREESLWHQRKKTVFYLIILVVIVMVAIMTVRYALDSVDLGSVLTGENTEEKYSKMYNASRYFFRLYFPDRWDVETDSQGFLLDAEQDLVLELYPTVRKIAPSGDENTGAESTVRDSALTVSFYYKYYTPEQQLSAEKAYPETAIPTGNGGQSTALLEEIATAVYGEQVASFNAEKYTWSELKTQDTADIPFRYFTYQYTEDNVPHTADLYIAVRASNYYIIIYDGVSSVGENAYQSYKTEFLSILEEFRFSVFDN